MGQIMMKLVQSFVDLKSMLNASAIEIDPSYLMVLRGLVCYCGSHYVAFSRSSSSQKWLMFDDANVVEVGANFGDCHPVVCEKHLPAITTVL